MALQQLLLIPVLLCGYLYAVNITTERASPTSISEIPSDSVPQCVIDAVLNSTAESLAYIISSRIENIGQDVHYLLYLKMYTNADVILAHDCYYDVLAEFIMVLDVVECFGFVVEHKCGPYNEVSYI